MAELNIFHFLPGKSIIHRMDSRIKLLCMIILSVAASSASRVEDLFILTFVLIITLLGAALPVKKLFNEIRSFFLLIAFVIIVHSFSIPGTPILKNPSFTGPTLEGLYSGLLFGWRIIIIVFISITLIATTTLSSMKHVIEWFLRPLPFIPATKIATMMSLTFTLIPLIFDSTSEMLEAQKARCIGNRRNPAARIFYLVYPLVLHAFRRVDEMAYAMESRCYSGEHTPATFKAKPIDWLLLALSGLVCIPVFW